MTSQKKSKEKTKNKMEDYLDEIISEPDYEIKLLTIEYANSTEKEPIKCLYPVLKVGENYKKKEETYERAYANCIAHKYVLVDSDGLEINISEDAEMAEFDSSKGSEYLNRVVGIKYTLETKKWKQVTFQKFNYYEYNG